MLDLDYRTVLWIITIALWIYGYFDYIKDTVAWKTTPHLFSWIVFLIMDAIAFLIQIGDNAGPWAWGTLATGLMWLTVFILALKNGEKNITKSDIVSFSLAILCIILYIIIENPIYSLITVLLILVFAMYPTFRKSYFKPWEETISLYAIAGIRSCISIIATVNISILTIWLPVFLIAINTLFITMVTIRKKQLKN